MNTPIKLFLLSKTAIIYIFRKDSLSFDTHIHKHTKIKFRKMKKLILN